jgi:hypothetical protein
LPCVENKGEVDEMLISLQEKNTELENDVNTGKERLDNFKNCTGALIRVVTSVNKLSTPSNNPS